MPPDLTRRNALILGGAAALPAFFTAGAAEKATDPLSRPSFSLNRTKLRIFHPSVKKRLRVMVIADTHSSRDDVRGEPFRKYSARMAKAYQRNRHFLTGKTMSCEESFEHTVALTKKNKVDLLLLAGDILSFPSEAGVEWVREVLKKAGLPFLYTAGNHDWHYEGTEGPLADLRTEWIRKRLLPLYQGENPLAHAREVNGVRFLAIDNSTYEILPEQLAFFRSEAARGKPMVLMVHIPLYMPGRSVGFGCGHPKWGAASDRNHQLERRPKWPANGHSETTMAFHREVVGNSNLLAIFAGHLHTASVDVHGHSPQFVAEANFRGGFLQVSIEPPKP